MANGGSEIVIKTIDYRPCIVDGRKALFHKWNDIADTVADGMMVGSAPGQ